MISAVSSGYSHLYSSNGAAAARDGVPKADRDQSGKSSQADASAVVDDVQLSAPKILGAKDNAETAPGEAKSAAAKSDDAGATTESDSKDSSTVGAQTDPEKIAKQRIVDALEQRDREVRQHELAHMSAGAGVVTGGPSYSFQTGPDGKSYAIGGEVPIDMSPGKTPEETIEKARTIRSAALAPSDPSGPDLNIAARASQMESAARLELSQKANDKAHPESAKSALSLRIDNALNSRQGQLLAVA